MPDMEEKTFAGRCRAMAAGMRSGQLTGGSLLQGALLLEAAAREVERGHDERDIRRFSRLMTARMARKLYEGHRGWREENLFALQALLDKEIGKVNRDYVDIANFAMMLHNAAEANARGPEADEAPIAETLG